MANEEHLKLARQGKDAWNTWRKENHDEPADFSGADFRLAENKDISFEGFKFGNGAVFQYAKFGDLPRQWQSNQPVAGGAVFNSAKLGDGASFEHTKFGNYANFNGTIFGNKTRFDHATFGDGTSFDDAEFGQETRFDGARFEGLVGFTRSRFYQPPNFAGVANRENLSFVGTQFWTESGILRWTTDWRIVTNLRNLRGIAKEIYATDIERDLFILERMAERHVLWGKGKARRLAITTLIMSYLILSNYGRSVALPIFWIFAVNGIGFFSVYWLIADKPNCDLILSLVLVNLLPIGTFVKPAMEAAVIGLFAYGVIPWGFHVVAILQGITNAILVFLVALALRNYFKVK